MTPRKTVRQEMRETGQELAKSIGELRLALDALTRWQQLAELRLVNLEHVKDGLDARLTNMERSTERLAQYVGAEDVNTTATPVPHFEELPY